MSVIGSLSSGLGVLKRNPVIVGLVFVFTLLNAALAGLNVVNPFLVLAGYLVFLFFVPFYLGGVIGMTEEGLRGSTTVGRFFSAGASNYLSLLLGCVALFIITLVLYFVVGFVAAIVAIFALGLGSMASVTSASIVVIAVVAVLAFLVILLPWFVLQFFPAALVVDDLGLVDSIKRSGSLVKSNFLSVVGFNVLAFVISLLAQVPTVYLFAVSETPSTTGQSTDPTANQMAAQSVYDMLSTTELAIYLGLFVFLGTIVYSVSHAFYVAYYDQLPR